MSNPEIKFDGLKFISIAIWLEVGYILINGMTGLVSLLQIAAMSEISQGALLFTTKVAPDIVLFVFIANTVLYIIGLNGLKKLNPYYGKAFKFYVGYLIFLVLSVIVLTIAVVTASGFAIVAFRTDAINTSAVTILIWVAVFMILAMQVVGNVLNIIYMRNIMFGTRRIVDILGGQDLSRGLKITERIYRIAMIVATVMEVIGVTGVIFVFKRYILKIAGEGADAFIALYSALRGMQGFFFLLTAAYIIVFIIRGIFAIRLTQTYMELSKHELSEEEVAMLLEDKQAVQESF